MLKVDTGMQNKDLEVKERLRQWVEEEQCEMAEQLLQEYLKRTSYMRCWESITWTETGNSLGSAMSTQWPAVRMRSAGPASGKRFDS